MLPPQSCFSFLLRPLSFLWRSRSEEVAELSTVVLSSETGSISSCQVTYSLGPKWGQPGSPCGHKFCQENGSWMNLKRDFFFFSGLKVGSSQFWFQPFAPRRVPLYEAQSETPQQPGVLWLCSQLRNRRWKSLFSILCVSPPVIAWFLLSAGLGQL